MSRKKQDEWGTAPKVLAILEEVNGRPINPQYLHMLWKNGRIARRPIDGRTFEYNLTQARGIKIEEKQGSGRRSKTKQEEATTSQKNIPSAA